MYIKKRLRTHAAPKNDGTMPALENPLDLAPDDLRNRIQSVLGMLCEADRQHWSRRLLSGLEAAGVRVGASLFMLGIVAGNLDDLTPSDIAKLLRYLRINAPASVKALAGTLTELLAVREVTALPAHGGRFAA